MKDSTQQPGPRPGLLWPALAALLLILDTSAPDLLWRAGGHAVAAVVLLLLAALPLSLALADHGLLLALRAGEQARLAARYGSRSSRLAVWVDLAGPLQLALFSCSAGWLLCRGCHSLPWAVAALLAARAALDLWLGRRVREPSTAPLAGAVALWGWLLRPLVALGARAEPQPLPPLEEPADQVLAEAIEVGDQDGELSLAESNLLRRELGFGQTMVGQVMVPWPAVESLHVHETFGTALARLNASSHSRFPVVRDDGAVVAVLHAKDLLPYLAQPPATMLQVLAHRRLSAPLLLPATLALDEALRTMRAARCSLAVAVDAAGQTVGVVAIEDLVEELVGEIVDESDAETVRDSLVVDGRRTLAELAAEGLLLPGAEELTLAEFLAAALGETRVGLVWRHGLLSATVVALDADGGADEIRLDWGSGAKESRP